MDGKCYSYCLGFFKCHPCMPGKSNSDGREDFKNCRQHCTKNFFQAPLGILAGKCPGHRYRYWLRFWSRFPDQTFRCFSKPF